MEERLILRPMATIEHNLDPQFYDQQLYDFHGLLSRTSALNLGLLFINFPLPGPSFRNQPHPFPHHPHNPQNIPNVSHMSSSLHRRDSSNGIRLNTTQLPPPDPRQSPQSAYHHQTQSPPVRHHQHHHSMSGGRPRAASTATTDPAASSSGLLSDSRQRSQSFAEHRAVPDSRAQRVPPPPPAVPVANASVELDEEPLYVNAKQYHRILKRRVARARLAEIQKLSTERKVCGIARFTPQEPPLSI